MIREAGFAVRKLYGKIWCGSGREISQSISLPFGLFVLVSLMAGSLLAKCTPPDHAAHVEESARSEKVDPWLGIHWQALSDPNHPERPRRLILVDQGSFRDGNSRSIAESVGQESTVKHESTSIDNRKIHDSQFNATAPIVIHAGQVVFVHQDTQVLQSRLRAVALQSATRGQTMLVRLQVGSDAGQRTLGPVVQVVANGKGEATWAEEERNRL